MNDFTAAFIGLGLIGGSIARGLKRSRPGVRIMAYMRTLSKLEQARADGIVDVILDGVDERLSACDMIFLCTPVEYNAQYLASIKPLIKPGAIVTDVGSTKTSIHEEVIAQGMEGCFIGGHPMAGSEKTGYENSTDHLLENAYYIITPTALTRPEDIGRLTAVAESIGSIPLVLNYRTHDFIVAAISHLPHLVASSLVNLVKASDDPGENMKRMAAGGFKDITRIASSSPEMWEQICVTNHENLSELLERYIASLNQILGAVRAQDQQAIHSLFQTSRDYRNSFADRASGPVTPDYSFTVDILDEPGSISVLSAILAARGINIQNIGINHNREHGEGALRISFYDKEAADAAWSQLLKYNFTLIPSL